MFLLDTNVVNELRKPGSRVDPHVFAWARSQPPHFLHLSSVVVFELDLGVRRVERRHARQGASLRAWLERVLAQFDGRILPFDLDAARTASALHVPDPRPHHDSFIAATALAHGLTVVTRNARDFAGLGVAVVNPWEVTNR